MTIAVGGLRGRDDGAHAPRFPVAGEMVLGGPYSAGPGGKGSNQAIGAARLGARVEFLTAIGGDSHGRDGLALWRSEGVGASG